MRKIAQVCVMSTMLFAACDKEQVTELKPQHDYSWVLTVNGPTSISPAGTYSWNITGGTVSGNYICWREYRLNQDNTYEEYSTGPSFSSVWHGGDSYGSGTTVLLSVYRWAQASLPCSSSVPTNAEAGSLVIFAANPMPYPWIGGVQAPAEVISSAGYYTWEVAGHGGNPPLSYTWEMSLNQGASWSTVGSSAVYSRSVAMDDHSFRLRVTVNFGGGYSDSIVYIHDVCPDLGTCAFDG